MHSHQPTPSKDVLVSPMRYPAERDGGSTPSEPAHSTDDRLESLADRIPDRYRLPTVLHCFHGMKMEEIARALDLPVSIVQSRLARGIARLERMMGPAGWDNARESLSAFGHSGGLLSPPAALNPSALFARATELPAPARAMTVADLFGEVGPRSLWGEWCARFRHLSNRLVGSLNALLL